MYQPTPKNDNKPSKSVAEGEKTWWRDAAFTKRTRTTHARWEKFFEKGGTPSEQGEAIKQLERERKQRRWAATTAETNIGHVLGVLRRLGARQTADIRDYARAMRRKAAAADTAIHPAITTSDAAQVFLNLKAACATEAAAFFAVTWATAARAGDAEKLQTDNILLDSRGAARVFFVEGKTVPAKGPFTIHTMMGPAAGVIRQWLRRRRGHKFIFTNTRRNRDAVRKAITETTGNPADLRMIRLGAIQAMANAVGEDVLMMFSRHTNSATLNRYLGWGWHNGRARRRMAVAAEQLWNDDAYDD